MNLILSSSGTEYYALIVLAAVVLTGMLFGRKTERYGFPPITGYIIAGVIIGGVLVVSELSYLSSKLSVISYIGLGFVAYGIGTELLLKRIKKSGKEVVVITIVQALCTAVLTTLIFWISGLIGLDISFSMSLVFGAIATATAPAPILLITRKYESEGPLTDVLLPLVGLDDAIGIVIFGISISLATAFSGSTNISFAVMLAVPLLEIIFSIVIGTAIGLMMVYIDKINCVQRIDFKELQLALSVGGILIAVAIAQIGITLFDYHIHLSAILTPMFVGFIFTNLVSSHDVEENEDAISKFQNPLLISFFTLAGVELVVKFFNEESINIALILIMSVIYIVSRTIGKVFGGNLGAKIEKSHPSVRKHLGSCLLPHAGVAIGMAYTAKTAFEDIGTDESIAIGSTIMIVVLISTLVFALVGPILVKHSLDVAGENKDILLEGCCD